MPGKCLADPVCTSGLPRLDRVVILYLALPTLPFTAWLQPVLGAVVLMGLVFGLSSVVRGFTASERLRLTHPAMIVPVVAVAVAWSSLGGAGHLHYSNWLDWEMRDAVLHDLVVYSWPVTYTVDDVAWIMRAPIGYFLPPAVLGMLGGVASADSFALMWTTAGVLLLLFAATEAMPSWPRLTMALALVVFFSGLDVLPYLALYQTDSISPHLDFAQGPLTRCMEFWAQAYQYSSNTTALFWAPNHGLPGWLAGAVLVRNWRRPELVRIGGFVLALIPLWSPLTAIGVAPLVLTRLLQALHRREWRHVFTVANLAAPLVGGPAAFYLIQGVSDVPHGAPTEDVGVTLALSYTLLILFEVLPWLWVLERLKTQWTALLLSSVAVLLVLPMFKLGGSNDLVMRASITPLIVLCLAVCERLRRAEPLSNACALATVAIIGAVTPATEMMRSLSFPRWSPVLDQSMVDVQLRNDGGLAAHYVALAALPGLQQLLRWDQSATLK